MLFRLCLHFLRHAYAMRLKKKKEGCEMRRHLGFISILGIMLTAGCGGGAAPQHFPCPAGIPGSNIVPAPPDLVYPAPGSSGIPDGNFTAVVAYGVQPPGKLEISGAAVVYAGAWTSPPSPLPSPSASAPPSDAFFGAPVPQLSAKTLYTVLYQVPGPCNSPQQLGTFTTQ